MVLKTEGKGLLNVKLTIEYDGKNYFGWQRQKNRPTIQETIENCLFKYFGENIRLTGSGRTDTGVHAIEQTANFHISEYNFNTGRISDFVQSVNAILPPDISILQAELAEYNFNSRYNAVKRIYKYLFTTIKPAINNDKIFYYKQKFDQATAEKFCDFIAGTYSFKTLCKNKSDKNDYISKIYYANITKKEKVYSFEICGIRFLHSMVRAIVGAMLKVSSGKLSLDEFKSKFLIKDRINIQYVPSYALYLLKVIY